MFGLLVELVEASIVLGAPLFGLSWFLFSWMYGSGDIDRNADQKSTKQQLKSQAKSLKKKWQLGDKSKAAYIYGRWAAFGGGFYGLAALWTFVVIEVTQAIDFTLNFPGFAELFEDGVVSFAVELLINQIGNMVSAFVWFGYWPSNTMVLWVLVAYAGYRLGMGFAKEGKEIDVDTLKKKYLDKD
ncbi:MAG: hypothetical protein AB8B95_08400 [Pseudohongiellaceae bacterium]